MSLLWLLALCGEGCIPPGMIYSTSQLVDKSAGDLERKQRTLCPHKNTLSTVWEENLPSGAAQTKKPSSGVRSSQSRNHPQIFGSFLCDLHSKGFFLQSQGHDVSRTLKSSLCFAPRLADHARRPSFSSCRLVDFCRCSHTHNTAAAEGWEGS